MALIGNRNKLHTICRSFDYSLFDLINDPGETRAIAATKQKLVEKMKVELEEWRILSSQSCGEGLPVEPTACSE